MTNTHAYQPNLVIVISGPSGSGKSTVINALCETDETLRLSVSATTRKPRPHEVEGVDYHFLSKPEFETAIQQHRFLEWAEYGGNLYGTLKSELAYTREAGKDAILEIEVAGSLQIRETDITPLRSVFIFLLPSSFAELAQRLRNRNTESETERTQRLAIAKSEIRKIQHYDYYVTNPDAAVHQTVHQIRTIIAAERTRIDPALLKSINRTFGIDTTD